uniref:Uncharacterized protein n=1 Tax=Avena sativa TaxID=4498 RepID=A0ACD5ZIW4_AVESA
MELCRRLTSLPPPHHRHRARCLAGSSSSPPPQHAEDRISALPDDMLLVVLARLGCASAAARTAILSRRWGRLWTRLTKATFRDVQLGALEAALASLGPEARLLDICPAGEDDVASDSVSSVLRAAARLLPVELVFTLPQDIIRALDDGDQEQLQLPHFHRATSMELDTPLYMALPPAGEFPALERLCISRWYGVDFAALILRCPRLRVLRARCFGNVPSIKIHSASLEELVLDKFVVVRRQLDDDGACHIDIVAPGLKQLTVSFTARTLHYSVSISAPMLHNLSWHCWYSPKDFAVGAFWYVMRLWLTTTTKTTETRPPAASLGVLANDNSLSMEIYVHRSPMMDAHGNFAREIEKLPVADFTILVLYLKLMDQTHVFGPMVTHLLATNQIRTSTRKLKVVLDRWSKQVNEACPRDCPCDDEPNKLWRTKTISFPSLEEVEIEGFQGLDDDLDFLKRIFQCAPTLKTMTVKLLDNVTPNDHGRREIDNTFKKYPFVKCYVTSVFG